MEEIKMPMEEKKADQNDKGKIKDEDEIKNEGKIKDKEVEEVIRFGSIGRISTLAYHCEEEGSRASMEQAIKLYEAALDRCGEKDGKSYFEINLGALLLDYTSSHIRGAKLFINGAIKNERHPLLHYIYDYHPELGEAILQHAENQDEIKDQGEIENKVTKLSETLLHILFPLEEKYEKLK